MSRDPLRNLIPSWREDRLPGPLAMRHARRQLRQRDRAEFTAVDLAPIEPDCAPPATPMQRLFDGVPVPHADLINDLRAMRNTEGMP